jgi:hypothetical protein
VLALQKPNGDPGYKIGKHANAVSAENLDARAPRPCMAKNNGNCGDDKGR